MISDEFLSIGIIIGVHGLHGRLKIFVISDIKKRFETGNHVYLKSNNTYIKYKITEYIEYKKKISLLRLDGISTIDEALKLKKTPILITKDEAEKTRSNLDENSYYYYDVISCEVFWNDNKFGEVVDIFEGGCGEILVIKDNHGRVFNIPFVESMVDVSSIADKRLIIHPIEGLIEI